MKVMRGILNKLTPEKFGKLVDTVKTMPINTTERLSAVIDLIFEKVSMNLCFLGFDRFIFSDPMNE